MLPFPDVYSNPDILSISAEKRKCYFHDEIQLSFYTNYSRANCLTECRTKVIRHLCGCQPYFYPGIP